MFDAITQRGLYVSEHRFLVFANAQTTPAARNYVGRSP